MMRIGLEFFPVTDIEFISQNNQYLVIVKIGTVPLYEQKI